MSSGSRSLRIPQDFNCFANLLKVGGYVNFARLWMTYFFMIYLVMDFCLSSESVLRRLIKKKHNLKNKLKIVKLVPVLILIDFKS